MLPLSLSTLVAASFLTVVVDGKVAERFQEGKRFYYLVSDYALAEDFWTTSAPSPCYCRRRCQALTNCSSVTILPKAGNAAEVDCRMSPRPTDISVVGGRPRLEKYSGAIHFLPTVPSEWKEPDEDGLIYTLDMTPSTWSRTGFVCKAGEAAVATTLKQFKILTKYLDTLGEGVGMIVELCQYCFKGDRRPITWGYVNRIPYADTELDKSLVVDPNPGFFAAYHFNKVNSEYKFIGTDATDQHPTLCQDNDLNLEL